MYILTQENKSYNLNCIPDESVDLRYCVFDCADVNDTDYFFIPLIFLESFYAPAVVLNINGYTIQMPLEWSIIVCDEDYTDVEVVPLTQLNDRGFHTPLYNPLRHMVNEPAEISITNVYAEVKWFFPKLKSGNLLVVPVEDKENPKCVLFVQEKNKVPNNLDIAQLFM